MASNLFSKTKHIWNWYTVKQYNVFTNHIIGVGAHSALVATIENVGLALKDTAYQSSVKSHLIGISSDVNCVLVKVYKILLLDHEIQKKRNNLQW